MQKIAIGILGYNEEFGIGRLLDSLRSQTLIQQEYSISITVVSNGSTDRMAAIAREALREFAPFGIQAQVIELPIADKCNAWNHFVHHATEPADYYILLDADVVFITPTGLSELIDTLKHNQNARLCAGKVMDHNGNVVVRKLDGKCYAAQGEILRQIVIPEGIVMDDAYVLVTAVTHWYEIDVETGMQKGYLARVQNPTVQSGSTPRDRNLTYWLACRKRTIIGSYVQEQIDFCMRTLFGGGDSAKQIVMQLFQTNPHWFSEFLKQKADRPPFKPSEVARSAGLKNIMQFSVYCYCYLLSLKSVWNHEFGHHAWKLKSRYW
ncbi:glycosyltransferase family A protein [Leptolyngbya sp. FACHB-711]|uniref:glycosyltransferase family A protein n=1 Tax=unclassified Leptolyngbya TaxID=2650499 RepID=UPI001681C544|nr:glycosyltransferase family A protein [Leptolyngbya sp. FACHB-711]MBD1849217.1 glycosyltransferase family 2 protein [Cyanobacteria bacterium FACHB-502]MBD2025125.1 glycosyltransferase family 2 protein [Leptolyngbya sp. FACHB-711]